MDEIGNYTNPGMEHAPGKRLGCTGIVLGIVLLGLIIAMIFFRRNKMTAEQNRQDQRQAELEEQRAIGHETSDANVRGIAIAGGILVATLVVVALVVWALFNFFATREELADAPPPPVATPQQLPPEPRLQVAPAQDWQRMLATDTAFLNSYGWIDEQAEVARIPVERSMELLAAEGLPVSADAAGEYYSERVPDLESSGGQPPEGLLDTLVPMPTGTVPLQPIGTPRPATTGTSQPAENGTAQPDATPQAVQAGARHFQYLGCVSCHRMAEGGVGPSLVGLVGSQVELESGETVTADEQYIRNSILNPQAQIVAGYDPVMPSFQNQLSAEELAQLVAYIRSLETEETTGGTQ